MSDNSAESIKQAANERFLQLLAKLDEKSAIDDPQVFKWLEKLVLSSDYAYQWLVRKPDWVAQIHELFDLSFERLEQKVRSISVQNERTTEFEFKQWLRLKRHFYGLVIVAHEIAQKIDIRQVTYLQSLLANQLIMSAYRWAKQHFEVQYGIPMGNDNQPQELVIMGMGKLGGMELNFSSDIDLIFSYPQDGETDSMPTQSSKTRVIENQKYFTRLAQKLVALLHETTADGFVYRVDMRLRPYGESGALVQSFDAMADYYLEQGREWERFAMIKANYLSLDKSAKSQLENIIKPFSFRRYIDFSVLEAIRQLKQKISIDMRSRNLESDIKLGPGGIRELEFIVQSLQLISGGRFPELQQRNWWLSLDALIEKNLLEPSQAAELEKAYEFLRRLENQLQLYKNEQTQQLPQDTDTQAITAMAMGYNSWSELEQTLTEHRSWVEGFFRNLFQEADEEISDNDEYQRVAAWIQQNKPLEPEISYQPYSYDLLNVARDFYQKYISEKIGQRGRKRLSQLIPHLVLESAKQPNSLEALERCLSILQSIGARTAYFEMLAENLPLLEHLVQLASRSKWLVDQLKEYPSLLDELLFPTNFGKIFSKSDLSSQLQQALLRIEPENVEEQLLAIGRFKVASQFKIATGFLNHRFHILEVTRQLTDVAELCLQALLRVAWRDIALKHGVPVGATIDQVSNFLVLGYGKLGSHELGFGSDLDLVFLYQGDPQAQTDGKKPVDTSQFYTRLTQRLVHYLNARTQQGIMYEVDMRLRPSGRSGLLVSELNAFKDYQTHEAWTWEKQALTRARAVAGDKSMAATYRKLRLQLLKTDKDLKADIIAMRQKMRGNLDRTNEQQWDIKQGLGGLVDIEFLVQYWILALAQQDIQLPDIYSNHYWLDWMQQNVDMNSEYVADLKRIYEEYHGLINHQRLDMVAGTLESAAYQQERTLVQAIWDSTFNDQQLQ
ncbi:MAG: bifunctional [glutamate--ammonia ligase]-adenylyl-L-tyrosine phosphorylase/[glutamate--ammonia-ligase] adenylyltransferase [Gammaproteobacteria bacterium]|nr:bifunctional [glutamate--ammonia ligase]-adenylyl-L-tyrosine phosphorylase/[glutamate--ammonia-ligase] adenylyltransferase [Gammaproteobacteria bacterium]